MKITANTSDPDYNKLSEEDRQNFIKGDHY